MAKKRPSFLIKRHSSWYFRQRIPKDLRETFEKNEIKKSLKTLDFKKACTESTKYAAELWRLFEKVRGIKMYYGNEVFAQLITVGETRIGNTTIPSVTLDLNDPEREAQLLEKHYALMELVTEKAATSVKPKSETISVGELKLSEAMAMFPLTVVECETACFH
jgi:hypothetical protein